ncbi:hypothetical protein GQR58_029647 [Nymphon striatum]|nr:hypothetical protein GQR58_029647 [Nymphon striatum]
MTIADDDGVWLTLENVVLDWNRSALLRGRVEVESLTAERLDLPRLPVSEAEALPEAEAAPFSLPQLPVSIRLETFSIKEIALGAPVLGEEAALSVTASARLNDDLGNIDLQASRTDGKRGDFEIKANFERSDTILDLLLHLSEGENGIAARLLNIPGTPSVDMNIAGNGPIDDFTGGRASLDAFLEARDLSRFSALAGRELDGQTQLALKGEVGLLSGQFDLQASGSTTDLAMGIEQADAVMAGRTDLTLTVKRSEAGTLLRNLVLENDALSLTGAATLRTKDSSAGAKFLLKDLSLVLPQYSGPVQVSATASQDLRGWSVDAQTDGPYGAVLTAKGLATGPDAALDFTADIPDVKPFADQIDGPVTATGTLRNSPEGWQVETDATGPYQDPRCT